MLTHTYTRIRASTRIHSHTHTHTHTNTHTHICKHSIILTYFATPIKLKNTLIKSGIGSGNQLSMVHTNVVSSPIYAVIIICSLKYVTLTTKLTDWLTEPVNVQHIAIKS